MWRLIIVALLSLPGTLFGQDGLPKLKDGDIISADVINDIIGKLDNVATGYSAPGELYGEWQVTTITTNPTQAANDGYTVTADPSGLLWIHADTITFADNAGVPTFSTGSGMAPFIAGSAALAPSGKFHVINNTLVMPRPNQSTNAWLFAMHKLSTRKFTTWTASLGDRMILLEKITLPPAIPSALQGTATGSNVMLQWTDTSNSETGFTVYRRDTLDGTYTVIATPAANTVTYTDAGVAAGDHWYRVSAFNAAGESIGSNVVKVTAP